MKKLFNLLVILAFMGAMIYLAWTGTPLKGYVKGKLEDVFFEKTGLKVQIAKLNWILPLTLKCEGVLIQRKDGTSVAIGTVALRPSVRELLHGSIALRKLYLHSVVIDLPPKVEEPTSIPVATAVSPDGVFFCPLEISDIYVDGLTIRGENVPGYLTKDLPKLTFSGSIDCDTQNKVWTMLVKIKNREATNLLAMTNVATTFNYLGEDYNISVLFEEKNGGVFLPWLDIHQIDALSTKAFLKGKFSNGLSMPTQCQVDLACEGEMDGDWQSLARMTLSKEDRWYGILKNQFTGSLQGGQRGEFTFEPGTRMLQGMLAGDVVTPFWGTVDLDSSLKGPLTDLSGKISLSAPSIRSKAEVQMQYNDKLLLPLVQIDWDGTKVAGGIEADFSPILIKGDLKIEDLPLELFLPVSGKMDGNIHLSEKGSEQNVRVNLRTDNFKHDDLYIEEFYLQGGLDDLFGKAKGSLQFIAKKADWKEHPLGDLQIDTFHHDTLGMEWPFKIVLFNGDEKLNWSIEAAGQWHASRNKIGLSLKHVNGQALGYNTTLQQAFEVSYVDSVFNATPLQLKIDESTFYAALHEKGNNKELTAHFLNIPSGLLVKLFDINENAEPALSWNIKGHLDWQDDLDKAHLKLTVANKDAPYATTLIASLKSSSKENLICKWDFIHPENGLLRLFSTELRQLKLQSKGECAFNIPHIRSFTEKIHLPEFNGKTTIHYQFPYDNGQIFTHLQYQDDVFRLQGFDLKSDMIIAKGSVAYDEATKKVNGEIKSEWRDHALNAHIELHGEPLAPFIKLTAKYVPENEKEPVLLVADGQLAQNILTGQGKVTTNVFNQDFTAATTYQINLDDAFTTHIKATTSYVDKSKAPTQLGKLNAELTLDGPFKNLTGNITVNGTGLKIDGNKLPAWTAQSKIGFPITHFPFQIQFENNNFAEGAFSAEADGYVFSLNKAEATYDKTVISLTTPWKGKWLHQQFESSPMTIKVGEGLFKLQAKGNQDNFVFDIEGSNLPALLPLPSTPLPFSGTVNLEGHFTGPLNAPRGIFKLAVNNLHFEDKFFGNAPYCKAKFSAEIAAGKAHFDGEMLCPSIEPVTFNANLPINLSFYPFEANYAENAPIQLSLKASGALGPILDLFIPHVNAVNGDLNLTLNVEGTTAKPIISGNILLDQGSYENLETGTFLKDITLNARAENSTISIEELYASDGKEGTLHGKGHLYVDKKEGFPFELNCTLEKMLLVQKDFVRSAFNGNILFKGSAESTLVSGELQGVSSVFYIPEEIPEGADTVDVTFVNIPEENQKRNNYEKPEPKEEYPINLDVEIKTSNKLRIRGRGLESTWKGQAHISGLVSSPIVQGEVKIIDGTYDFKGRIFELRQGTISFAGPWDTKTTLYVIGSLEIDDTIIEALLRGPLKNPTLAFRSNPAMAQREIVSYLLFGKGPSEITPYQGNQLSQSISNLNKVGGDSPDLLTDVRTRLRIDRLDINREITSEGDKVSVQVGKYICKGVYVSLNKSITDDGNSIAVDARVINHVRARAQITDNAETQLLLKWRKDF